MPNFALLDMSRPDVATLVAAMQTGDAVERLSWSHPQEPTNEDWWADVLADPCARITKAAGARLGDLATKQTIYRLADEPRGTILVACSKCERKAAFRRDELIAAHGPDCPMPSLLERLAAPGCARVGQPWDRCGVHYVEPIEAGPRR